MDEPRDRSLGLLLLAALAVRTLAATASPIINADAYYYLESAGLWADGRWGDALRAWNLHPLYPVLAALAGGGWTGAAAVSVVAGSLAVLPLWALAKEGWGRDAARFAGLVYALHPVLASLHGRVLTEGLYHLAALTAVLGLVRVLRGDGWRWSLLGGLGLGAAYLARSEGVILAGLLALMAAGALAAFPDVRPRAARLAVLFAVGLLVASPYLLWLRAEAGGWVLTPRIAAAAEPGERTGGRPVAALYARELGRILWLPLWAVALPGLVAFRRGAGGGRVGAFLGLLALGYLGAVLAHAVRTGGYLSERYLSTAVVLLLPWAGRGLERGIAWVSSGRPAWGAAALLLVCAGLSGRSLDFRKLDDLHVLEAALWVRDHGGRGRLVLASQDAVAVHAEARFLRIMDPAKAAEAIREKRADFAVYREKDLAPEIRDALGPRPPTARFGAEGRGTVVYFLR